MIFVIDTNALVHVMYHITESKDPPDVVDRLLNRLDHLREWVGKLASEKLDEDVFLYVAFDHPGPTYRQKLLPTYKAHRTRDPEVYECINHAREALINADDWRLLVSPKMFEADDLIASICQDTKQRVLIHSSDKDFHQCLREGRVGIVKRSGLDSDPIEKDNGGLIFQETFNVSTYTEGELLADFGFGADHWVDYQCLVGDTADNIKGAQWIGPITAMRLIREAIVAHCRITEIEPSIFGLNARQTECWPDFLERYTLLQELFTLHTDLLEPKD